MRKQTKWAVILGAAAVMTFGACMTSFAATGWVEEGGEWYYYNKDEEAVTEKWQKGNDGTSFYLGDEGTMIKSDWVEGDDVTYYVNSYGARCINEWRYMYGKDDESAEEESWFYFDANGKMAKKKTTVNGKTYYFDADGKMVTGWLTIGSDNVAASHEESAVDKDSYYTNKDGERITGWIKLYSPEDPDEDDDQHWYHFKTDGKVRLSQKATINNKNYVFDGKGEMVSGWVYADLTTGSEVIESIDEETDPSKITEVKFHFYTGGEDDGSIKKNVWINSIPAGEDDEDSDIDKEWYYTAKDGRLYYAGSTNIPTVSLGANKAKAEEIGKATINFTDKTGMTIGLKKVGTKNYLFNEEGMMIHGLIEVADNAIGTMSKGIYYFGKSNDGVMKTTTISLVDDDDVSHSYAFSSDGKNGMSKGQGVTGVVSSKLFNNGLLVKAQDGNKYGVAKIEESSEVAGTIALNDTFYIVNESGRITTGIKSIVTADSGVKYRNLAKLSVGSATVPAVASSKGYIVQKHLGVLPVTVEANWSIAGEEFLEK